MSSVSRRTLPLIDPDDTSAVANADHRPGPAVQTSANASTEGRLTLELQVTDPETVAELLQLAPGATRNEFALRALRVGVLALRQARGQLDGEAVRREGDRLLGLMQERLEQHTRGVHDRVATTLKDYFDPQTGRFQERVERLVKRDGELEQLLRRQLGAEDSELAKTLAHHVGSGSDLLQWLAPDQSRGLLALLKQTVEQQLTQQREHVLKQFSLDQPDGALVRFLGQLREHHGEISGALQEKIDEVVRQFSLDHEDSALSRLVANVETAQRTITQQFSLDNEQSALARFQKTLSEQVGQIDKQNREFQTTVSVALASLTSRKNEAEKGTRHGLEFEQALSNVLMQMALRAGDTYEATGDRVGEIRNCKKGDGVIVLGPESVVPGGRIVVEAKQVDRYQLSDAMRELEEARRNRRASVGIFVFSRRNAPAGLDQIHRSGDDIYVVWDAEDEATDLFLRLAYSLARTLCVRQEVADQQQSADLAAIEKSLANLQKEANGFDDLQTAADQVGKQSTKMLERIRIMRTRIEKELDQLMQCTAALKQHLE